MDKLTPEQRHRNMQNVHSKGTKIEIIFAKLLHEAGVKYIKNDCKVFGCPDFVFRQRKVAVFLDGDFWHGRIGIYIEMTTKPTKNFGTIKSKEILNEIKRSTLLSLMQVGQFLDFGKQK